MTYRPGESGNINGRPRGSLNRATHWAALINPHIPELIAVLIAQARSGDVGAMRIVFNKLVPKIQNEPSGIELPVKMTEKSLVKLKDALLLAALEDRRGADETAKLIKLLDDAYGKQAITATTVNFLAMTPNEAAKVYQQIMKED